MRRNRRKLLSAGVVIVRGTGQDARFLLLRAFRHWDFPKGLVEPGESPLQAAVREVREESSIDQLDFRWGEDYIDTGPYNGGKTARYFLASTAQESVTLLPSPDTGRPEHCEYRWVSAVEARALASPRVGLVLDWALSRLG
jgi:bis(5'-nucleosidyl)-tetraphosphatase